MMWRRADPVAARQGWGTQRGASNVGPAKLWRSLGGAPNMTRLGHPILWRAWVGQPAPGTRSRMKIFDVEPDAGVAPANTAN
jgi:hypothetical protein